MLWTVLIRRYVKVHAKEVTDEAAPFPHALLETLTKWLVEDEKKYGVSGGMGKGSHECDLVGKWSRILPYTCT